MSSLASLRLKQNYLVLLQCHRALERFDYDQVVDWAASVMEFGRPTPSTLIIASMREPVSFYEIQPHLRCALKEYELSEKEPEEAGQAYVRFWLTEICLGNEVRLCINELKPFWLRPELDGKIQTLITTLQVIDSGEGVFTSHNPETPTVESAIIEASMVWLAQHSGSTPLGSSKSATND